MDYIDEVFEAFDKTFWAGVEEPETAKDISPQIKHFLRTALTTYRDKVREALQEAGKDCQIHDFNEYTGYCCRGAAIETVLDLPILKE
jgi:hypothetical protein